MYSKDIPAKYLSSVYGYLSANVGMENSIGRLVHTVLYNPDHDCLKSKILPRVESKLLQYNKSIELLKDCYDKLHPMEQDCMLAVFYEHIIPDIYGDKTINKIQFDCDYDDLSLDMSDIERKLWNAIKEDVFNSTW